MPQNKLIPKPSFVASGSIEWPSGGPTSTCTLYERVGFPQHGQQKKSEYFAAPQ
jgi:hypothetical protein